jgi:hypothetical protein
MFSGISDALVMKRSQRIRAGLVAFGIAVACAALAAWLFARGDPYAVLPMVAAFMSLTLSFRILFRRSRRHLGSESGGELPRLAPQPGSVGPPDDPWQELGDGYQKIGAKVVSVFLFIKLFFVGFVFLVLVVTIVQSYVDHDVEGEIVAPLLLLMPCFAAWRILKGKEDIEVGAPLGAGIVLTATAKSPRRDTAETAETPHGSADTLSRENRRAVSLLTLPEEFALLSLTDDGAVIDPGQARVGCALAELGDLALRGKLLVRYRRLKLLGVIDVYVPSRVEIELIDTTPVGVPWADELLAELARTGETVVTYKALRRRLRRRDAFLWHRDDLVTRGLIQYVLEKRRFRRDRDRYRPDLAVRATLIKDLGSATSREHPMDAHMMLLSAMVIRSELNGDLGIPAPRRRRGQDRADRGGAAEAGPEQLRVAIAMLAWLVPKRSRHQGGDDGGD